VTFILYFTQIKYARNLSISLSGRTIMLGFWNVIWTLITCVELVVTHVFCLWLYIGTIVSCIAMYNRYSRV